MLQPILSIQRTSFYLICYMAPISVSHSWTKWMVLSGQLVWQRGVLITNNNQYTEFPGQLTAINMKAMSCQTTQAQLWHNSGRDNMQFLVWPVHRTFARQWFSHYFSHVPQNRYRYIKDLCRVRNKWASGVSGECNFPAGFIHGLIILVQNWGWCR